MYTSNHPVSLRHKLLAEWADKLEAIGGPIDGGMPIDATSWIGENYLVDRPRDPTTARILPAGNIRLAPYQTRIIREAMSRDSDGKLKYSTILWSEPKKSGKTAIAAAIGLYMANINKACHIYCLANDGKQSKDRIFNAMARCLVLHNRLGGEFAGLKAIYSPPTIRLPNGSQIEAIPCDAAGEAGAEPLMTIWSEMWGYAQKHKERIWTEMTIPPTLYGYAMRWVESYAGYAGESTVLEMLYDVGINQGRRHTGFPNLPVYVNDIANQLSFWSHDARQPWQTQAYYNAEAKLLTPNEFTRIHKNEWVTSTTALFEDMFHWDRCIDRDIATPLPVGDMTPTIVAVDAGYASDTAAIVMTSRHPEDEWDSPTRRVVERYAVCFKPPKGSKLDFTHTIEPVLRRLAEDYNVYRFVYDPYQLHKLCTDLRMDGIGAFQEFNQMGRRLRADKQLYDMIVHRQYIHSGNPTVREHVFNTSKKEEGRHLRFVKRQPNLPIDLIVATSMAVDENLRLNT